MPRDTHARALARPVLALACLAALAACSSPGDDSPLADGLGGAPDLGHDLRVAAPDAAPATDPEVQRLAAWMTGTFSSEKQSQQDPAFFHITLVMKRIWATRADAKGYWLYVEQSVAGSVPYRQRIYHLERHASGKLVSRVLELASPALEKGAIGAWKQPDPLASLTTAELVEKPGCSVFLTYDAGKLIYTGGTEPKKCLTTYQGATYTTSSVEVTERALSSWDRGFDADDQQVWGAVKGPYVFDRVQDLDPELN